MKKIIFILSLLFLSFGALASPPSCTYIDFNTPFDPDPQWSQASINYYRDSCGTRAFWVNGSNVVCARQCSCPSGSSLVKDVVSGISACTPIPSSSSSSSSSSSACPSNAPLVDALGKCNTKCTGSTTYNPVANSCEVPASCSYPEVRSPITNTCNPNSEKCALGAHVDILSGYSCQADIGKIPSCPVGWTITETNQCIQTPSSTASGSAVSSTATSTSNTNTSTATSQAASSRPSVPTQPTDNTSQTQNTQNSAQIPAGISYASCMASQSQSACTAIQNCQLTFGVNNCVGMTTDQNCPNQYAINGQKICVLSTSGTNTSSGSNASSGTGTGNGTATSQAGECDPTSKKYDECMGRHSTPTETETAKMGDDIKAASDKAMDDYAKAMKDNLDAAVQNGVGFKGAADGIKSAFLSHVPQASPCKNLEFKYLNTTKNLDCSMFEKFKIIMAWFLSIVTIIYIFKLAVRPVES